MFRLWRIRGLLTDMALAGNGVAPLNPPRQAQINAFPLVIVPYRLSLLPPG
jgi:hypothetical protein